MMFASKRSWLSATLVAVVFQTMAAQAAVSNFEDLSLAAEGEWTGDDLSGTLEVVSDPWNPPFGTMDLYHGGFASGSVSFGNTWNNTYMSWEGWAYSNQSDTTTLHYENECSAITGTGMGPGQDNYAVAYCPSDPESPMAELPSVTKDTPNESFNGMYVTNTTYAALAMENGYFGAKKFGGVDGNDEDWMLLTVYGEDAGGELLAPTVETYMADYRFADNSQDYITTDWSYVDLAPLSAASKLYLRLTSSDTGDWGMNTPSFIAVDNISTTESMLWNNAGGDGDWFNSANWDPQETPQPSSLVAIDSGSAGAASDVSVNGGGSITVDGAATSVSFPNLSVGNDTSGTLNIRNAAAVNVSGTITVGSAGIIDVGSGNAQLSATVVNGGTVNVQAGNSLSFAGPVSGSGDYTGSGSVVFGNQFSPGDSMATVNVGGEMVLSPGSTLMCEVSGQGDCDRILVDEQLTITGSKMKLDWLPGESADSIFGGIYTIATYAGTAIGDAFDLEDGSGQMLGNIGSAYVKSIDYSTDLGGGNYAIVVDLHDATGGDADLDGDVDGDDLATFGLAWNPAGDDKEWFDGDFDFDGDIDGDDLAALGLAWAPSGIDFGSGAVEVTAVPEPTTAIMLLIAAGLLLARKRR